MPRKPGRDSYSSGGSFHYNKGRHDYRGHEDSFKWKKGGTKGRKNHVNWASSVRAHFEEEDIDMGSSSNPRVVVSRKFKRRDGRGGGGAASMPGKRRLFEGPFNWYRVLLPYGNKYEKSFVLKKIAEKIEPIPLIPICWGVNGQSATFYVDDFKTAEKIYDLDRTIQMPDGFNLIVKVMTGCPNVDVTPELREKMKAAMGGRYNAATKALDLTKFHADPALQHAFCALFKPIILLTAVDIVADNIPELEALNLFENNIHMLVHLKKMAQKLPNLKVLHIGNNKVKDVGQLDSLIGLPIVDLMLDGNPLCDKFTDKDEYISEFQIFNVPDGAPLFFRSEVRKRFPKVMKLDGLDLPAPISFDIATEATLPDARQTYLCNPDGQAVIAQFLEQYFGLMDGDDRAPLRAAYHERAVYSMTTAYPYGSYHQQKGGGGGGGGAGAWLNWYLTDSRNLRKVTDTDRRHKLLKQGNATIVAFLKEMPATKHDMMSFTVDLNLCTPQMLLLTITGIFKELRTGHKQPPVRYFFRTLVIVPQGSGFCIANEEYHVTNATDVQIKQAFKAQLPPNIIPDVAAVAPAPPQADLEAKKRMVEAVSQQSGMNLDWSEKCLQDTNWDFQMAMVAFTQAHKDGKIPAEAFVK